MKFKTEYTWYTVEFLLDGKWEDSGQEHETKREARSEMNGINFFGHKIRMVEHRTATRIVGEKDFSK